MPPLCFFKRGSFSARHLEKQGTRPAAPPGKRAQPALNGDFPLAGNPRAFLPAAKSPGGAKKAALQRFRRADTERNAGGGCILAASWEEVVEKMREEQNKITVLQIGKGDVGEGPNAVVSLEIKDHSKRPGLIDDLRCLEYIRFVEEL